MYSSQEKMTFLLCQSEEMSPHFKLHMEKFSYFARWFYFLMVTFYQVNKTEQQKFIQKCWSSRLVLLFSNRFCLLHKQTEFSESNIKKEINKINKYLHCNELHLFPALFLFWFQWYTEEVFMFGVPGSNIYI